MQVAICTPVWGRPLVTQLFHEGAKRLAAQWSPHSVRVYVSGSEPEQRELASWYDATWLEQPNDPLGRKWNNTVEQAWTDGADYCVILGSDDVLTPVLGTAYKRYLERGHPYIGVSGCHVIEPTSKRTLWLEGRADNRLVDCVGPARGLSREMLDPLEGRPYRFDSARSGMELYMGANFIRKDLPWATVIDGSANPVLDVKTGSNIWSFERLRKAGLESRRAYDSLIRELPAVEAELVRALEGGAT